MLATHLRILGSSQEAWGAEVGQGREDLRMMARHDGECEGETTLITRSNNFCSSSKASFTAFRGLWRRTGVVAEDEAFNLQKLFRHQEVHNKLLTNQGTTR